MDDPFDLERFVRAQDSGATYASALRELEQGRKQTHWMWFVFPQIAGLGHSATAQRYAVSGLPEARAYLAHPVLGLRLVECALTLLGLAVSDPVSVFGPIDAQKLRSSMTLFSRATSGEAAFDEVLDRFFGGEPDGATIERL